MALDAPYWMSWNVSVAGKRHVAEVGENAQVERLQIVHCFVIEAKVGIFSSIQR
jgi:hypothetical protein